MPCYCDPSLEELDESRKKIRIYAEAIVYEIRNMVHPTQRYPQELVDAMKLIEHLFTGKCDEKSK
jgi:hypothetical protein